MQNITINQTVNELLKTHIGGHKFFTAMDEAVRNPNFFYEVAYLSKGIKPDYYIVTGQFGMAFANWNITSKMVPRVLVVRGGLKHKEIKDLPELDVISGSLEGQKFVMLDDTLFNGTTFGIIKENIERRGGTLNHGCFCYDGCKEKKPYAQSLYRYYDNFKLNEG